MGIRHIATSIELATSKTVFYGNSLNHVRGHYFWLRRKLGIKKAIDTIRKIGSRERRITNDIIHTISRDIVNRAIETNALIVLGDIKHLRKKNKTLWEENSTGNLQDFSITNLHNISNTRQHLQESK
jgi:IS605 OrfB family transposase